MFLLPREEIGRTLLTRDIGAGCDPLPTLAGLIKKRQKPEHDTPVCPLAVGQIDLDCDGVRRIRKLHHKMFGIGRAQRPHPAVTLNLCEALPREGAPPRHVVAGPPLRVEPPDDLSRGLDQRPIARLAQGQRLFGMAPLLDLLTRLAIEPGVFNGYGPLPGDLGGKRQIILGIAPTTCAGQDEGDHAHRTAPGLERQAHERTQLQGRDEGSILRVLQDRVDQGLIDVGDDLRLPGARHVLGGPATHFRVGPPLQNTLDQYGIAVRKARTVEPATFVDHIHGAPIREGGHDRLRKACERRLVIEILGDPPRHLRQNVHAARAARRPGQDSAYPIPTDPFRANRRALRPETTPSPLVLGSAQPGLDGKARGIRYGLPPGRKHTGLVLRVHQNQPALALEPVSGDAEDPSPFGVMVVDNTLAVGGPHHLREPVAKRPIPRCVHLLSDRALARSLRTVAAPLERARQKFSDPLFVWGAKDPARTAQYRAIMKMFVDFVRHMEIRNE